MVRFCGKATIVFGLLLMLAPVWAKTRATANLPDLSGAVILTVTGLDPADHPGGQAQFDLARLQAMERVEFKTSSIWTDGVHGFAGVPLSTLVELLQIGDATLTLHALNDYDVKMPASETGPAAPILAYEMDGAPMDVRDKGPIWVLYPFDADLAYRSDTAYTRSVWQLDRIDVTR